MLVLRWASLPFGLLVVHCFVSSHILNFQEASYLLWLCRPWSEKCRVMRKPTFWFPTWSDTNQAVQLQKMAKGLKFWIYIVEGLYYLWSENKDADQLRGYRAADLRLCFRICKTLVFSWHGSKYEERIPCGKAHKWAASWENLSWGFPIGSDTKWAVQPQKMAIRLKFWI